MTVLTIRVPDIGEGITEVELVDWNVSVGSLIREDDVLASVMTDKATVEIPSLYEGTVVALGCEPGQMMAVGSELARIEVASDAVGKDDKDKQKSGSDKPVDRPTEHSGEHKNVIETLPRPPAAPVTSRPAGSPMANDAAIAPRNEGDPVLASPSVRSRARDAGIDLRRVVGSGPAGRISHADLDQVFVAAGSSWVKAETPVDRRRTGEEQIRVVGLRRKIAERMSLANSRIPHITIVEEVDVTALEDLRNKMNAERGSKPKLTVLPFIIAALSRALIEHPEMNAHYYDDAGHVTRFGALHVGIATMTDAGLVVPVLRHAEALDLYKIASEITRLADSARTGKATREELAGSTFTITSLGPLGAVATTPIINHPEVAILGVNKMAIRPMWDGQQFVPRTMMNISASFDHRVIDGWDAAKFIQRIKMFVETPAMIFIG